MDAQLKALPTLPVRARTVSGCVNSANLNISQHFTVHLFSPWIPSPACGKGGGPRRFTAIVLNVSRRRFGGNTVELAVRYVPNRASNYSPLTKGGYRGVPGRGDPAGLGRKITPPTPPTPPSQGGDEFAISTATLG